MMRERTLFISTNQKADTTALHGTVKSSPIAPHGTAGAGRVLRRMPPHVVGDCARAAHAKTTATARISQRLFRSIPQPLDILGPIFVLGLGVLLRCLARFLECFHLLPDIGGVGRHGSPYRLVGDIECAKSINRILFWLRLLGISTKRVKKKHCRKRYSFHSSLSLVDPSSGNDCQRRAGCT